MSQSISAMNPNNTEDRTEMANAYARLGMLLTNELRPADAAGFIGKSVAIMEQLHREDPKNALYARDLAIVQIHLARALCQAGQPEKALPYSQAALSLSEILAENDPGNAEVHADVALSHRKLAETLLELHDVRGALAHGSQSVALWSEMAKNSQDANTQVNLGRALRFRGDAQAMANDLPGAAESYRQAVDRLSGLVKKDAANAVVKSDLARTFSSQAQCFARLKNQRARADESYGRAIELWDQLRVRNALLPEDAKRADEDSRARRELSH